MRSAQAAASALDAYDAQISQIDNMLADTTSGLSPALQDFFNGVQDVAANPRLDRRRARRCCRRPNRWPRASRASNGRLEEIREGVNSQIDDQRHADQLLRRARSPT